MAHRQAAEKVEAITEPAQAAQLLASGESGDTTMAIAIRPHAFTMSATLADPEWAQVLSDSVKDDPKAFDAVETLLAERKKGPLAGKFDNVLVPPSELGNATDYEVERYIGEDPAWRKSGRANGGDCSGGYRGWLERPRECHTHGSIIVRHVLGVKHGDAAGRRFIRMAGDRRWIAPCNPRPRGACVDYLLLLHTTSQAKASQAAGGNVVCSVLGRRPLLGGWLPQTTRADFPPRIAARIPAHLK